MRSSVPAGRRRLVVGGRVAAILVLFVVVVVCAPAPATARPPTQSKGVVTVATYNIYLGANLSPLFVAPPGPALVATAAAVYHQMVATDFPARAQRIAREIVEQSPAVVGLQEVALWQTASLSDPTALQPTYDFLEILLGELAELGVPYQPVATNVNFSGALPISATTVASFTDRDVILTRADSPPPALRVRNPSSHTFAAMLPLTIGGQPILVPRGWSSVEVRMAGRWFLFVNTHLEAFSALVRTLQAQELVASLAASRLPVVLAGDLNTLRGDRVDAYGTVTGAGFLDGWVHAMPADPGFTAGQDADLRNVPSELDHTVDYVMVTSDHRVRVASGSGDIIGEELADRTPSGLWPSDHAGVTLGIAKQP